MLSQGIQSVNGLKAGSINISNNTSATIIQDLDNPKIS